MKNINLILKLHAKIYQRDPVFKTSLLVYNYL